MHASQWTPQRLAGLPKARRKPPFSTLRQLVKVAVFATLALWIGGVFYFLSTMLRAKAEPGLKTAQALHPESACPKMVYWRCATVRARVSMG
jgi:Na+-translocating ferredoxin:NAD+ oxidoreductase RNF subunit RnfB